MDAAQLPWVALKFPELLRLPCAFPPQWSRELRHKAWKVQCLLSSLVKGTARSSVWADWKEHFASPWVQLVSRGWWLCAEICQQSLFGRSALTPHKRIILLSLPKGFCGPFLFFSRDSGNTVFLYAHNISTRACISTGIVESKCQ